MKTEKNLQNKEPFPKKYVKQNIGVAWANKWVEVPAPRPPRLQVQTFHCCGNYTVVFVDDTSVHWKCHVRVVKKRNLSIQINLNKNL